MGIFKIDRLEEELQKIRERVADREDIFESRSEKWQESEKGEAYQYATEELDSAADTLENLISEIKEIE